MKLSLEGIGAIPEDYALADSQRALHLEHTPGFGVITKPAWARHRPTWALAYSRIRGEATRTQIEAAQLWAYLDTESKGSWRGWNEVLASSQHPAEVFCRNLARLLIAARASNQHKFEKYSPGPGAPTMYYVDDRKVTPAEYHRLKGGKS